MRLEVIEMKLSNRTLSLLCVAAIITCSMSALAQSPSPSGLPGFRIEADTVNGEPAIAHGA